MPEDQVYTELVGFLGSSRADLQKAAVEATLGVVHDPNPSVGYDPPIYDPPGSQLLSACAWAAGGGS